MKLNSVFHALLLALVTFGCVAQAYAGYRLSHDCKPWVMNVAQVVMFMGAYDFAETVVKGVWLLVKDARRTEP